MSEPNLFLWLFSLKKYFPYPKVVRVIHFREIHRLADNVYQLLIKLSYSYLPCSKKYFKGPDQLNE